MIYSISKKVTYLLNDLPLLLNKMRIENIEKCVSILLKKNEYVMHIVILKQEFNHGLVLKAVQWAIKLKWKAWLKPKIDIKRLI